MKDFQLFMCAMLLRVEIIWQNQAGGLLQMCL